MIYAVRANTQNSSEILMRGLRSNLQDIGDCFEVQFRGNEEKFAWFI